MLSDPGPWRSHSSQQITDRNSLVGFVVLCSRSVVVLVQSAQGAPLAVPFGRGVGFLLAKDDAVAKRITHRHIQSPRLFGDTWIGIWIRRLD